MPIVPKYQEGQVGQQIGPTVRENIRIDPAAAGGGRAKQAAFGAGKDLISTSQKIFDAAQKRVYDTQFFEGDSKLSKIHVDYQAQIKNLNGKDSVNYQKLLDQYKKDSSEAIKDYQGDELRFRLEKSASQRGDSLYGDGSSNMQSQLERYELETNNSYVKTARNEALFDYKNPEKVNASLERQAQAIDSIADNKGLSGESRKLMHDSSKSTTHMQIIDRMVNNGEDLIAKEYHKKNKKQIVGADIKTVEKLLDAGNLRGESQRKADKIFASADSPQQAYDKVREIKDPKLRDETKSRVDQRYSEKKFIDSESIKELNLRSTDLLDKDPDVDAIPRADWNRFSRADRSSLKSYAKSKRSGDQISTDPKTYQDLMLMASGPKTIQNKFIATDFVAPKYLNKLSETDRKAFIKLAADKRQGKGNKELDDFRTIKDIVNKQMIESGVNPKSKDIDDQEKIARFHSRVAEEQRKLQDRTGKRATHAEIESISARLLTPIVTEQNWLFFDKTKRAFELDPGEGGDIEFDNIPLNERLKVEDALRRNGQEATEDNVIRVYSRKLEGITER